MGTSDSTSQTVNQDKSPEQEKSEDTQRKCDQVKTPVWVAGRDTVNRLLDSTYYRLRPLETLFLVSVVLCCTLLCLYVTYSHLQLRDEVRLLQEELSNKDFVSYKWRRKVHPSTKPLVPHNKPVEDRYSLTNDTKTGRN